MMHSAALLALSAKLNQTAAASVIPGYCFAAGIVLFSGSIYCLVLQDEKKRSLTAKNDHLVAK